MTVKEGSLVGHGGQELQSQGLFNCVSVGTVSNVSLWQRHQCIGLEIAVNSAHLMTVMLMQYEI